MGKHPMKWAGKVTMAEIAKLYESDAKGFEDGDLADEVGYALLARCDSILAVTRLHDEKILDCPVCGKRTNRTDGEYRCECGFAIPIEEAHESYKKKQLYGLNAAQVFREYIGAYPKCREYREKMLAIDRLIHGFHSEMERLREAGKYDGKEIEPGRPVSANLIEGTMTESIDFLRKLSASPVHDEWMDTIQNLEWIRSNKILKDE